jgi:predicted alpha-1,2-mannosidase
MLKKQLNRIFCSVVAAGLLVSCASTTAQKGEKLTDFVDPLIGTADHGHTFPGAVLPFGGVQLSPDNPTQGWDWCSGYNYADSVLAGFSHTHLSGTGIGDLQDVKFLPVQKKFNKDQGVDEFYQSSWSLYDHKNEIAKPGYYALTLDNGIKSELTVSQRCGFHRYSFPANGKKALIVDLKYKVNWDDPVQSHFKILDDHTLVGYRLSKGWAKDQRVYFVARFSKAFQAFIGEKEFQKAEKEQDIKAKGLTAYLDFGDSTDQVLAKVGISSASIQGALKNLETEMTDWDFDAMVSKADAIWEKELAKIRVQSDDKTQKTIFYTAAYHSYLAPYTHSDANGEYKGPDDKIHKANGHVQYTVFSLWDTFRAAHPLFTLTQTEKAGDMVKSMLDYYKAFGQLPIWDLCGNETFCMIGYHSVPVIAEAYFKGIGDFDAELAYEAMKATAMKDHWGLSALKKYNYIPWEMENESVSKTLEYAYDDWCIAQVAKVLGKSEDYHYFMNRANSFRNLFDASTGFMRGKNAKGQWKQKFDPLYSNHRDDEYTEGNAWQYSWFVPHDIEGLVQLHGGKDAFVSKLDSLFTLEQEVKGENASVDISGLIGQYAQGNEPSHHVAYMYNYVGQGWKTQELVHRIRKEMFTAEANGICGNDDCGQMSAWYVFSSVGFYPVNPVEGIYVFGTPLFKETVLSLSKGMDFRVVAPNVSDENIYIQKVFLNGKELNRSFIYHKEVIDGGELKFEMGAQPNTQWATNSADFPPSMTKKR